MDTTPGRIVYALRIVVLVLAVENWLLFLVWALNDQACTG